MRLDDKIVKEEIAEFHHPFLDEIQLADNVKARIQDADGKNPYRPPKPGEPLVRSQYAIYNMLGEL